MGREIKRVPLNFAWPKDRWCGGSGEPPKGAGYQLWETVSEGSAISPVFATPEELAKWLVESPDYKWRRNDDGTTYDQWLGFIRGPGWAPTLIGTSSGVITGVQATCGVVEHTSKLCDGEKENDGKH